ncbi:hypothetical protein HMN09_01007200 [Mycena chlorophos]|uniref:Enterotoxin n=1 Tax=Mycena chlorophos TaxID=658473 RepID=A0A8H6W3F4_MYCCL|nr:hypothetical protein HMN09_01007200 [Mycena chlorophos]
MWSLAPLLFFLAMTEGRLMALWSGPSEAPRIRPSPKVDGAGPGQAQIDGLDLDPAHWFVDTNLPFTPTFSSSRRGAAAYSPEFIGTGQSIAPLLARAIARESDGQLDAEPGDVAPLGPLDELGRVRPALHARPTSRRKKQHVELADGPTQATKALSGSHRRRASKRRRDVAIHGHTARPETIAEHVHTADFQNTDFPTQLLPTATGAYVAKVEDADELWGSKKERSVEEYLARGFHLVETGGSWLESDYPAVAERLLASTNFNRLAGFASASLGLWAPRLHGYYVDYSQKFDGFGLPRTRPFPASVFAAAAFNFGPRAWTHKHRDVLNLPFGWCAIIALGNGLPHSHPLRDAPHSNVKVQSHEMRASFTQFTAGGLFRLADNGFRTEDGFAAEEPEAYLEAQAAKEGRWKTGLGLWSTVEELMAGASGRATDDFPYGLG